MKIGENTEFKLELKTIIGIVVLTSTLMGMYYTLEADIEEAKELPPSEIKRMEYDLKQKWQTEHIEDLEEKVDEILFWCRDMDKELHNKKNK
jgi:K+/H+ antiporter YhaU regulatory subunit KhtT